MVYRGLNSGPEYGVVAHVWENEQGDQDCYVVFFGDGFPMGEPTCAPYVLRYYAASLEQF